MHREPIASCGRWVLGAGRGWAVVAALATQNVVAVVSVGRDSAQPAAIAPGAGLQGRC